jgi:predicted metal-binding membrane protein
MSTVISIASQVRVNRSRAMSSARASDHKFYGVSALLFIASAAITIVWCAPMSAMGMPMPGGWTMSMAWMRMPGQTWPGAAASFLVMWTVMMVAMMMPSLVPMLARYRGVVRAADVPRVGRLTVVAGAGYFTVWSAIGLAVFLTGVSLAIVEMQQPAIARVVPIASGVVVLIAGALQFSPWKAHHLACCRAPSDHHRALSPDLPAAWRHGVRLGLHCVCSSAGLTAILLVLGVMDLRVMVVVMAAITVERLGPASQRIARVIGSIVAIAGVLLIAQAVIGAR